MQYEENRMKIFSIYDSMQQSALLCPNDVNVKLIIRHSIRQEINSEIDNLNAQLTREGIEFARKFGKELDTPIGTVSSSCSQRCIDTCKNILGENSNKIKIQETDILQTVQNYDDSLAGKSFSKYGVKGIFDSFVENKNLPGINSLEYSVSKILDFIFLTGNKNKTIDIFCTHDFQIGMMLLFLNGSNTNNCEKLFENWIYMLEGFFLYGNREKFTLIWRGEKTGGSL
jgi:hypothetical protein